MREKTMMMNDEEKILNLLGRSPDPAAALELALKLALTFIETPPRDTPSGAPDGV